jgi:hypothetical protein
MSRFEAPPGIITNGLVLNLDAGDPDSYTRSQPPYVEVLVVAGGGGGGVSSNGGGGGGAGGLIYNSAYQLTNATAITVTIGAGGVGSVGRGSGTNGSNSVFGSSTAIGGGRGGGHFNNGGSYSPNSGGSGGGGSYLTAGASATSGQGFAGGSGAFSLGLPDPSDSGGGGGGASEVGYNGQGNSGGGGAGGNGSSFTISGTSTVYAGGGAGATNDMNTRAVGGSGGGGGGGTPASKNGDNGTANTGGGGGGGNGGGGDSGNGGSGIVIVRYPGLPAATGGTITYLNGYTIHTFTTSGTFTPYLWNDVSGNNNSGSLDNGVGFNSYQSGGYLNFDGSDDYVVVPGASSTNLSSVLTADTWVYYRSGNGRIFQKDDWGSGTYTRCWEMGGYAGTFRMEMWHQNGTGTIGSGNPLAINGWTYLTLTFDGTNIKMYQNSTLVNTINFPGDIRTDINTPITVGGRWVGEFLDGGIGVARLYNRALSAAEITQNYNAQKNRFGL